MVMEEDLSLGSKHTVQYTDHVLQNLTLETYIILLANVTLINCIKKENQRFSIKTLQKSISYIHGVSVSNFQVQNMILSFPSFKNRWILWTQHTCSGSQDLLEGWDPEIRKRYFGGFSISEDLKSKISQNFSYQQKLSVFICLRTAVLWRPCVKLT